MLRNLHSWPALVAGLLVTFMALTGTILSLSPAIDHFAAGKVGGVSVAGLAAQVAAAEPGVQRIVHTASGLVIAYARGTAGATASLVDPQSGTLTGPYQPSAFFAFITELHRSLFLGEGGQVTAGIGALALLLIAGSGIAMLVKRLGGWRRLLGTARGTLSQRLHVELTRMGVLGLGLTALTGIYMALVSLGLVASGPAGFGPLPPVGDGGTPLAIAQLPALQAISLADLRELSFPAAGDPSDVFTVTTAAGQGFVDQASGKLLSFIANDPMQTVYEWFFMLHTGQGAWWLGLLLGLAALAVPGMAITGTIIWWRRRSSRPRIDDNAPAQQAEIAVLVGSETGATWGFAATLHAALVAAGRRVHTGPMNDFHRHYGEATRLIVITSTTGNGAAPQSASRFLGKLAGYAGPRPEYTVLGFGDHSFQHYSAFASEVDAAFQRAGWTAFEPRADIDRQSAQAFADWGRRIGSALGLDLRLNHVPTRPTTTSLEVIGKVEYGRDIQAPTTILRLAPADPAARLPRHVPGDLLAVIPPGSEVPRYYSLASGRKDGFLEICVRKQSGGLCSEFLTGIEPGSRIEAFVRPNPDFRPARGRRPVVMIANGSGIAPFIGTIWRNRPHRQLHLYWGGRRPDADFLYEDNLDACLADGRLTSRHVAFSRIAEAAYVQDRIGEDAASIAALVKSGAQFMVCGSRDMADGVAATLDSILAPLGESIDRLRQKGRYLEDVY